MQYRLFTFVLSLLMTLFSFAQSNSGKEYQVKAVFIFRFTQFTEWPPSAFASTNAPFVIGILGEDPFGPFLDKTVENESVEGHPIIVQRFRAASEVKNCHMLFFDSKEASKMATWEEHYKNRSILTVSDAPLFLQKGGIIKFYTDDNKIKLQINPEAAKSADLVVSSKLLRLAEIVVPAKVK